LHYVIKVYLYLVSYFIPYTIVYMELCWNTTIICHHVANVYCLKFFCSNLKFIKVLLVFKICVIIFVAVYIEVKQLSISALFSFFVQNFISTEWMKCIPLKLMFKPNFFIILSKTDHCTTSPSLSFCRQFLVRWTKEELIFFPLMATYFCTRDSRWFYPSSQITRWDKKNFFTYPRAKVDIF